MKNGVCVLPSDFVWGFLVMWWHCIRGTAVKRQMRSFLAKHCFLKWNNYGKHQKYFPMLVQVRFLQQILKKTTTNFQNYIYSWSFWWCLTPYGVTLWASERSEHSTHTWEMTPSHIKLTLNSIVKGKSQEDIWSMEMHVKSKYCFAQWVSKLWHYLLLNTDNMNNFEKWCYHWLIEFGGSTELTWSRASRDFLTVTDLDSM